MFEDYNDGVGNNLTGASSSMLVCVKQVIPSMDFTSIILSLALSKVIIIMIELFIVCHNICDKCKRLCKILIHQPWEGVCIIAIYVVACHFTIVSKTRLC